MALSVETGGIKLASPMVPQLNQANALAGLKPLSFTGGLQTPLSFQAPRPWNIASNHPEAITAGVASAANTIMAAYKSKKDEERDLKKMEMEAKKFAETERHNKKVEEAAFKRIETVLPKGKKEQESVDYSDDSGASQRSRSQVVDDTEDDEAYLPTGGIPLDSGEPTESLVVPKSYKGNDYGRDFSKAPLKLNFDVSEIKLGDRELGATVVSAAPTKLGVNILPSSIKISQQQTQPPTSMALADAAFPVPIEPKTPVEKKESPKAVEARRSKGEVTPEEQQQTLLSGNEQVEKDASGMPIITQEAAVGVAKSTRNAPAPLAFTQMSSPQAISAPAQLALRNQEMPMYGRTPTEEEQKAVHNSAQEAQNYVSNFNRKFAGTGNTAKIVGEIPKSKSRLTGKPQWRVGYDFDPTVAEKRVEQKTKDEAAAASLALQKKRTENLVEQKLQSRAKAWEVEPIAKLMETRRDAMARFLVAADRALDPKKTSETSRAVVDQEMKDLFVTFATGRVPTEGQYHEINTAYRGLIPYIENKFKKAMTGQTLDEKDIKTIRSMMLETYNASARNVNNALGIIKEDLIADHPEVSERKHPTLYAILRLPEEIEPEVNAAREEARILWNSGDKKGSERALDEYKSLMGELERARKEGASNAEEIREFKKGTFPGFHAWRFGGAAETPVNNPPQ
jgi:hypothetical protein